MMVLPLAFTVFPSNEMACMLFTELWTMLIVLMLSFMSVSASSEENWASCEANSVFSTGFSGSWYWSCFTSRFRNMSLSAEAVLVVLFEDDAV